MKSAGSTGKEEVMEVDPPRSWSRTDPIGSVTHNHAGGSPSGSLVMEVDGVPSLPSKSRSPSIKTLNPEESYFNNGVKTPPETTLTRGHQGSAMQSSGFK